ncbi:competence/damage-inducible protein A [soil metagenome]
MNQVYTEIITIGDEILYGQIVDTNSAWMGAELGKIGIKIKQITSISDDESHILRALDEACTRADVILITGGLGPTKDDLTKKALTRYFHTELVLHEPSLADVTLIFSRYGRELTEVNRQQAFLPAACEPVRNILGTAPGMWFAQKGKIFVSMPGVPFEMKRMMEDIVLPRLKAHFGIPEIIHKVVQTIGIGESFLADRIADWEDNLPPNIRLAYLPSLGSVRLRLTGMNDGSGQLEQQLQQEVDALGELIQEYIFGYGEISLEEAIGNLLSARALTIATAEGCTGGNVAHKLTSVSGSSQYFLGGLIAYANEVKVRELGVDPAVLERHGAVSEEVARAMAEGVRRKFGTTIGVATTGVAGPTGGTDEKPVGTVWIAYADESQTVTKKLFYHKNRLLNIEYSTLQALNLVRQSLPQRIEG